MLSLMFSEYVHEATQAGVLANAEYHTRGGDGILQYSFSLELEDSDDGRALLAALQQNASTLEQSANAQDLGVIVDGMLLTISQR